jgi:acetolactate synthase-1/2/3 large subunit
MIQYKGGDLLMKCLADLGVTSVFGMGGHGNLALCDGLYNAGDRIKAYIIHDESVGASAAGGYYRATGNPGVLLVTNGPGMQQAIPGLIESAMSNDAVIVISGDMPSQQWGNGAEEELDINQDDDQTFLYRGFAKRIFLLNSVEQIPRTVARAYNVATSGRPGVVLINMPVDVQAKSITEEMMKKDYDLKRHICTDRPRGGKESVKKAAELLLNAKKPVILCGVCAVNSDAGPEVEELAELLDAPVCSGVMGHAIMGGTNPYYAGRAGAWGNSYPNECILNADVMLTLGNRFEEDESGTWGLFNPSCKLIHVHIDPREIGKIFPVEVGIQGDPKAVAEELVEIIKASGKTFDRGTKAAIAKAKAEYYEAMKPARYSGAIPIDPHRLVREIDEAFPENGVRIGGAICARDFYALDKPKQNYYGYGMDLIGTTLAQALGFSVGLPDKRVISVEGDGGFMIHSSLLATAAEYHLPITWVIVNNSSYGTVWGLQRDYYGDHSVLTEFKYDDGTVYVPNYAKMAEAFHVKGIRIEDPKNLKDSLKEAMNCDGPCLVDVVVNRTSSSTPPTVSVCGWDSFLPYW